MTRIITAPADQVTPQQFMRAVLGPSQAERAAALAALTDEQLKERVTNGDGDVPALVGEMFRRAMVSLNEETQLKADIDAWKVRVDALAESLQTKKEQRK